MTAPARDGNLSRLLGALLGLALLLLAIDTFGAAALHLLEGRASANAAFWIALVLSVALCLLLPLFLDLRITRAYRRFDSGARATALQTIAVLDALLLVLLVALAPRFTRASLESHGAWFARGVGPAPTSIAERATAWLARHVPRSEPPPPDALAADAGAASPSDVDAGVLAAESAGVDSGAFPTGNARDPQSVFQSRADTVAVIAALQRLDPKDVTGALLGQLGVKTMRSFGSGVLVAADGRILTNQHVVDHAESLQVTLRDGRQFPNVALLAVDKEHDLVLLTIDTATPAFAPLAPDDAITVGERAIAIGSPLGLEYSVTDGIVSAVRDLQGTTFLQMQTPVAPGSSGGPLFDVDGRVIGVNTASKDPGLNLAVHVKHARELLAKVPQRRALATFTVGAHVAGITVDGAEVSSVDRMTMQDGLELLAAGAEGCVEDPGADAFVAVTFHRPPEAGGLDFQWVMRPAIDSNLPPAAQRCLSSNLQIFSMAVGMAMAQAFGDELSAGKTVVLHTPIAGLHGHAVQGREADKAKEEERALDVRFVMSTGGAADAAP